MRYVTRSTKFIGDKVGKEAAEVKRAQIERLHQYMDEEVMCREKRMQVAKQNQDDDKLWALLTAAVGEGYVRYLDLIGVKAFCMQGRSKVEIMNTQLRTSLAQSCGGSKREKPKEVLVTQRVAGIHRVQMNRLLNFARRMVVPTSRRRFREQTGNHGCMQRQKVEEVNLNLNRATRNAYLAQACKLQAEAERKAVEVSLTEGGFGEHLDEASWVEEHFQMETLKNCVSRVLEVDIHEPIHAAKVHRLAEVHRRSAQRLEAKANATLLRETRQVHDEPLRGT